MRKTINYTTLLLGIILTVYLFVTAKTYEQLVIAIALYPVLVIFAFRIFPRNDKHIVEVELPKVTIPPLKETLDIKSVEKRDFLKLVGVLGASFFIFSIFNRRVTNLPFVKKIAGPETTGIEDQEGNKIDPAQNQPTDGYKISEVDDNVVTFYGFVKKGGDWFIMKEDTQNGSFRYVKGNKDFADNWQNRQSLAYDYYSNIF